MAQTVSAVCRPFRLDRKIHDCPAEPGLRTRANCIFASSEDRQLLLQSEARLSCRADSRSRAAAWPRRLTCNFCKMLSVILDGGGANRELARDLLIGAALLDERARISLSRNKPARRANIAAAMCGTQCMRPSTASPRCGEVRPRRFRARHSRRSRRRRRQRHGRQSRRVQRHQLGAAADGFDHPSGRGGVRLAQIDEHHIALRLSDFCDATRVQVDDANHYNISTVAQGGGQAISNSDEPDLRRSAE